jgi:hypothetical protein
MLAREFRGHSCFSVLTNAWKVNAIKQECPHQSVCYSPEEAGAIFGKSGKWAIERVKEGKLVAVDDNVKKGKNGLQPSQGIRITAVSVEKFRREFEIAPEKWAE